MSVQGMILRKQGAPDVRELRRLLERVTGAAGSKVRLAELLGCAAKTVRKWEIGKQAPSPAYIARLRDLEKRLKARTPVEDELRGECFAHPTPVKERPLPLTANVVSVHVEGDQALISFALKIPGENEARSVADVLVPAAILSGPSHLS